MDLTDIEHWRNHTADELADIVDRMTATSLATWTTNRLMSIETMHIANAALAALALKETP